LKPNQVATIEQQGPTYSIVRINETQAIRCERCQRISYSSGDIAHRYCGHCHVYHDDVAPPGSAHR